MKKKQLKSDEELLDVIFSRIDKIMKERKLYLNPDLTLPELSDLVGTNRTYASRAVCSRFRNFKNYINTMRVEHLLYEVQQKRTPSDLLMEDPDEVANGYGFHSWRGLDRVLVKETGSTYRRIVRRRRSR